jgi:glucose/arabinose dehydrogenase
MKTRFALLAAALVLALSVSIRAAERLPYTARPAFGGLRFNQPVGIVSPPGDSDRLFIIEKPGRIVLLDGTDPQNPLRVFLDLRARVGDDVSEQGVLALAFHPDWKRNRQFFVYYTSCDPQGVRREDRLARFLVSETDSNRADPASEVLLIAQADEARNHNGGELAFGPDGYLYLSLGDEGGANDEYNNGQRVDRDFFAGIIRIDVDRRAGSLPPNPHPAVRPGTYAVPADNPFVGLTEFNKRRVAPERVRTEFWAVGLRNPWRMSFDPATGRLWCGDIGQQRHEEINLIKRGGNYGWSLREGPDRFRGSAPGGVTFEEPVWVYPRYDGISVTGGLVYHGTRCPDLDGKYLFADYGSGRVWALEPDDDKPVRRERVQHIATVPLVVSFGRDPRTGDVLLATLAGPIFRLVPNPAPKS